MRVLIEKIYAKRLEKSLRKENLPKSVMVVTDFPSLKRNFEKFLQFIDWCRKFSIENVVICVDSLDDSFVNNFSKLEAEVELIGKNGVQKFGKGLPKVYVNVGITGKEEILLAVKEILKKNNLSEIDLNSIERMIEENLRFKIQPDLIIKADDSVPEFLIWQIVYSELYFIDADWESFRYIDFLRCLRDYQRRERRYGR